MVAFASATPDQSKSSRQAAVGGVPGDGLKAARAAAARQRNAKPRGGALRGRDAGYDLECDAGRVQRGGLLLEAAEHQRIARLETHDPASCRGKRHHQIVDVALLAGAAVALLADIDALGAR